MNGAAQVYDLNSIPSQITGSWFGRLILTVSVPVAARHMRGNAQALKTAESMMGDMPTRGLGMGGGSLLGNEHTSCVEKGFYNENEKSRRDSGRRCSCHYS